MPPKKQQQPPKKDQQQQQKAPAKRNNQKKGAQKVESQQQQQAPAPSGKQAAPQKQPQKQQQQQQAVAQAQAKTGKAGQPDKQQQQAQQGKKQQGAAKAPAKKVPVAKVAGKAKAGGQGGGGAKKTAGGKKAPVQKKRRGRGGGGAGGTDSGTRGGANQAASQRLELIIRSKYQNSDKESPSQLESQLCQYLVDLEASNKDLKPHLRDLGIVAAREIETTPTKKAIVIFVPFIQHTRWQKIQDRVVRELEKKFSGQEVVFVAQRKVMKLNQIKNNVPRDRTMTITAVHENLLNDIVYPTKIVGKRTRFRVGGKRILKVYLDPKDSKEIESRLATYEVIYNKLTKRTVKFMFPRYVI